MKRRDFLKTGIIGGGLGMTSLLTSCNSPQVSEHDDRSPAAATVPLRVRVPVIDANGNLTPDAKVHVETLCTALQKMRKITTKGNGQGWLAQAQIHNDHCPHGSWSFYPWHREYLFRFEAIIQVMGGNPKQTFTLPYWDWTQNPYIPDYFYTNPLFYTDNVTDVPRINFPKRQPIAGVSTVTNPKIVSPLLSTTDFGAFMGGANEAGGIEAGPHNGVHVALGGVMGTFMSPSDPIFWMHHANVDRIWAEWQQKNKAFLDPATFNKISAQWGQFQLKGFYDTKGVALNLDLRAINTLSTARYGYRYLNTNGGVARVDPNFNSMRRQPAQTDEALFGGYIPKAFTEGLKSTALENQGLSYVGALSDRNQRGQDATAIYLDQYIKHQLSDDIEIRLKVMDIPPQAKLANTVIKFEVGDPAYTFYYGFFDPASHHKHTSGNNHFNIDFKNVLQQYKNSLPDRFPVKITFLGGANLDQPFDAGILNDPEWQKFALKIVVVQQPW